MFDSQKLCWHSLLLINRCMNNRTTELWKLVIKYYENIIQWKSMFIVTNLINNLSFCGFESNYIMSLKANKRNPIKVLHCKETIVVRHGLESICSQALVSALFAVACYPSRRDTLTPRICCPISCFIFSKVDR